MTDRPQFLSILITVQIGQFADNMDYSHSDRFFILILILERVFHLREIKFLSSSPFEYVQHIKASCLKVRGCVIRLRYEQLMSSSIL